MKSQSICGIFLFSLVAGICAAGEKPSGLRECVVFFDFLNIDTRVECPLPESAQGFDTCSEKQLVISEKKPTISGLQAFYDNLYSQYEISNDFPNPPPTVYVCTIGNKLRMYVLSQNIVIYAFLKELLLQSINESEGYATALRENILKYIYGGKGNLYFTYPRDEAHTTALILVKNALQQNPYDICNAVFAKLYPEFEGPAQKNATVICVGMFKTVEGAEKARNTSCAPSLEQFKAAAPQIMCSSLPLEKLLQKKSAAGNPNKQKPTHPNGEPKNPQNKVPGGQQPEKPKIEPSHRHTEPEHPKDPENKNNDNGKKSGTSSAFAKSYISKFLIVVSSFIFLYFM